MDSKAISKAIKRSISLNFRALIRKRDADPNHSIVRPGRSSEISVVLLQVGNNEELQRRSDSESGVLAKRMLPEEALKVMRAGSLLAYDRPDDGPQHYYDSGILLYDPKKQLYDKSRPSLLPDKERNAIDQVLELAPVLPPEIALQIKKYSDGDVELSELTTAPAKFLDNRQRLEIHALVGMKCKALQYPAWSTNTSTS